MTGPRAGRVLGVNPSGLHRVAYADWPCRSGEGGEDGEAGGKPPVVCVHGLTRNAHDFDVFAEAMSADRRVVAVDVAGRGGSDPLPDPAFYGYPQYLADAAVLLAGLGVPDPVPAVDWVGTSMGGLIGMMLAARAGAPIRRLVLNDIGPFLPEAALRRIGDYVGRDPHFSDVAAATAYLRQIYPLFGPMTDAQWRAFARHSVRDSDGGGVRLAYDPAIGDAFREAPPADVDLWPVWDAARCPVLVIRGAESDILLAETAAEMTRRGPAEATVITIDGVGHTPALMDEEQIGAIRDWLDR